MPFHLTIVKANVGFVTCVQLKPNPYLNAIPFALLEDLDVQLNVIKAKRFVCLVLPNVEFIKTFVVMIKNV